MSPRDGPLAAARFPPRRWATLACALGSAWLAAGRPAPSVNFAAVDGASVSATMVPLVAPDRVPAWAAAGGWVLISGCPPPEDSRRAAPETILVDPISKSAEPMSAEISLRRPAAEADVTEAAALALSDWASLPAVRGELPADAGSAARGASSPAVDRLTVEAWLGERACAASLADVICSRRAESDAIVAGETAESAALPKFGVVPAPAVPLVDRLMANGRASSVALVG